MTILDTNVLSELMRPKPAVQVVEWIAAQPVIDLYTTAITEAELLYGLELLPRGKRRTGLLEVVEVLFHEDLAGHVLPYDSDAARAYAIIVARRRRLGKPIGYADAQIGAIAQSRGATLVTRDTAGFEFCDIQVLNPWS